jgi:hypothetical protein
MATWIEKIRLFMVFMQFHAVDEEDAYRVLILLRRRVVVNI